MRKEIVLVALIILLSGCISQESDKEGEEATIKVGVMPDEASLPYHVADKEGLFAAHGLHVEVVPFQSAMERDTALRAGEIDAGENDPVGVLLLRDTGYDVKIVSLELHDTADKMRFAIIASPQSNISTVEDLEGKTIAISDNTIIEYVTDTVLGDVQPDKVDVKKLPLRVSMLLSGQIDAATLSEPLASYVVHQGAQLVISDAMLGRNISQTVIVFSGEFISAHPDCVDTFLAAYSEAVDRINANPENYRALLVEKTRIPEEIAGSYTIATYLHPQPYPAEKFEEVLQWMQSNNLVHGDMSYEDVVREQ